MSAFQRCAPQPSANRQRQLTTLLGCLARGLGTAALGQSETNVTTEPWSAVEWIADADLASASFYWDSVPHCRNPPSACQVRGRAIPCSDCAKQRHDIIPNRLALTAEESVSGVTGATAPVNQETPPMRIYIIGKDGITLCREPPATVNKGEVAVASREELHAARLSGKRLLALWNALPGVEKQTKVGDRDRLIDQLWSAIEALPDPDQPSDTKRPSKQEAVIAMLQRPEGATVDEDASAMGWQRHTVRGLFSGTLKKKLGLTLAAGPCCMDQPVDAVIPCPRGLMRCGRSSGVPAPTYGSGRRQQLPLRPLDR